MSNIPGGPDVRLGKKIRKREKHFGADQSKEEKEGYRERERERTKEKQMDARQA